MTWLEELKPGDPVIFDNGSRLLRLFKVDRLTKLYIVVGEHRFRKDNGRRVGDSMWGYTQIIEPTPERLAAIKRRQLIGYIAGAEKQMAVLPLEFLEAFANRLKAINAA